MRNQIVQSFRLYIALYPPLFLILSYLLSFNKNTCPFAMILCVPKVYNMSNSLANSDKWMESCYQIVDNWGLIL